MISLNHIGIAVEDVEKVKKLFASLGLCVNQVEEVLTQGVRTHFLPLPPVPSSLELLEPLSPTTQVAKFIQKRGPGIHHLSFLVDQGELESLCKRLHNEGYQLIYPQPEPGAHGMKMNFIHPRSEERRVGKEC